MTVLGALARSEKRAMQATAWGPWPGEATGVSWSGTNVDSNSALQLLTVYGCNRFICEGISTLPVDTFRSTSDRSEPIANPPWLERPTADLDRVAWLTQILTSLLLSGNAFLFLDRSQGALEQLIPLDPAQVRVERVKGRKAYRVVGQLVDGFNILHIPGVMKPGSDVGMSPVEAARQSIGLGQSALEQGARHFSQGQVMSGVIEVPTELAPGQPAEMAKAWARAHSGKHKAHLPGVLQGGATWKPTGVTNEQAQFLETRGYTAAEIAGQMFLIDPSEFGLQAGTGGSITYANLEQRNARKVQVTFLPWLVRLERAFSSLLARPRYVKFNVNALLRGDTLARYQAHEIGIRNHFELPNEARDLEDMPPLPGGDEFPTTAPQGAPTP